MAPEHPLLGRPGLLLAQPDLAVGGRAPGQHLDHHEGRARRPPPSARHGAEHRGRLVGVDRLGVGLEPVDAAERTELVGIAGLQVVQLLLAGGAAEWHRDRGRLGPETGRNDPRVLLRHPARVACGGAGQPSPTVGRSAKASRAYLSMRVIQYAGRLGVCGCRSARWAGRGCPCTRPRWSARRSRATGSTSTRVPAVPRRFSLNTATWLEPVLHHVERVGRGPAARRRWSGRSRRGRPGRATPVSRVDPEQRRRSADCTTSSARPSGVDCDPVGVEPGAAAPSHRSAAAVRHLGRVAAERQPVELRLLRVGEPGVARLVSTTSLMKLGLVGQGVAGQDRPGPGVDHPGGAGRRRRPRTAGPTCRSSARPRAFPGPG